MTQISLQDINKTNTNIFRYSKKLWSALRKERFKRINLDKLHKLQLVSVDGFGFDPYPDMDLQIDLATFRKTLNAGAAEVFDLNLLGLTPSEISKETGRSPTNVYFRLRSLITAFREFYREES